MGGGEFGRDPSGANAYNREKLRAERDKEARRKRIEARKTSAAKARETKPKPGERKP